MTAIAFSIRRAQVKDGQAITDNLRLEDVEEWRASIEGGIVHLSKCIEWSIKRGECKSLITVRDDMPQVIWGVEPNYSDPLAPAIVWMVATPMAASYAPAWMKLFWNEYEGFFERWPLSECYSDDRNRVHHRWLEYLDFDHVRTVPFGPEGLPFRHYVRTPQACA